MILAEFSPAAHDVVLLIVIVANSYRSFRNFQGNFLHF